MTKFENMNGNNILTQLLWNNKSNKRVCTLCLLLGKVLKQLMISLTLRDPLKIGKLLAKNVI